MKNYRITREMIIIANRRANRSVELENSTGFVALHKIHKSKKTYSRKNQEKL